MRLLLSSALRNQSIARVIRVRSNLVVVSSEILALNLYSLYCILLKHWDISAGKHSGTFQTKTKSLPVKNTFQLKLSSNGKTLRRIYEVVSFLPFLFLQFILHITVRFAHNALRRMATKISKSR